MTSKRELAKRLDRLENRIDKLCSVVYDLMKITIDDDDDNDDNNNNDVDKNLLSLQQMSSNQIRNRFGEWLFIDTDRWLMLNRIIDRPPSSSLSSSSISNNQMNRATTSGGSCDLDQDQGYKKQRQKHIVYQIIIEANHSMILAGFINSYMMSLFKNPLFTIIRTSPEKMIIFIECQKTVENFLKHCHYDLSKGCWQFDLNNIMPMKITLEQSIYYD
ncbi:hypothetical protein DERP_008016 [Dermatophagoides pteronyssinus]|uniref:Uncharacterized protein n=1 Tax=Dermatophagoides pteronyssinus TaxID=6956 RepID=A0ABQ8ITA1_DERPT|nr:hypothetical protein DERP_008016 [Dermatophagoides pteronyssinus]